MTEKVNPSPNRTTDAFQTALAIGRGGHGAGAVNGYVVPSSSPTELSTQDGDISESNLNAFNQTSDGSSFDVTVGGGEAFIDGAWVVKDTSQTVTLAASTNNQTVYVGWNNDTPDDAIVGLESAFATASSDTDSKIPLFDFDTDGSGVTNVTDRRRLGHSIDVPGAAYFGDNEDIKVEWTGSTLNFSDDLTVPADTFDATEVDIARGLEDDGSGSIQFDEDTAYTFTSDQTFGGDIIDSAGNIIYDLSNNWIEQARLENDSITLNAGDGLKNGSTAALGGSFSLDIEPNDFAGAFVSDDGSDNLQVDIGRGLEDDGSGNIRFDEDTSYTFTASQTLNAGATLGADLDASSNLVTNLAAPSSSDDAARKAYVDSVAQGLELKDSVDVSTNGSNIDLASATDPNPVDGYTLSDGEFILLKDQTDASENGIYVANTATDPTTWTRRADMDEDSDAISGAFVFVEKGTSNASTSYIVTTEDPIDLGVDDIIWAQFAAAGEIDAGDGLKKSGQTLNIEPNDFAGSFLSDDGSDDLQLNVTGDFQDDGSGNLDLTNDSVTVNSGTDLTGGGTVALGGSITLNHADTSSQSDIDAGLGVAIDSITLDGSGHVTGIGTEDFDTRYDNYGNWTLEDDSSSTSSINSSQVLQINGGTDINTNISSTGATTVIDVSHDDTSNQSDVTTGGATVIDDIGLDARGHVNNLNTQNRSLDDWNGANANLNIGNNNLQNVSQIEFDNIEDVSTSQALGYDASEGLLYKDGNSNTYLVYSNENVNSGTDISISGGTGADSSPITISHSNTSSQSDVTTGGATVIDDIGLDGNGHVYNMNTQSRSIDDWENSGDSSNNNVDADTVDGQDASDLGGIGSGDFAFESGTFSMSDSNDTDESYEAQFQNTYKTATVGTGVYNPSSGGDYGSGIAFGSWNTDGSGNYSGATIRWYCTSSAADYTGKWWVWGITA